MFKFKQNKLVTKIYQSFSNKILLFYKLNFTAPLLLGAVVLCLILSVQQTSARMELHNKVGNSKDSSRSLIKNKKANTSIPTTPVVSAATVTPSTNDVSSTPVASPITHSSAPPEPVVVPSPKSSVSGLTPTSTAPATSQQTPATTSTSTTTVTTSYTSSNWSGYMATTNTYTSVSGSWLATKAIGNGYTTSADSTWIGIGGVTSADLIQVGTQNTISASGQISTSAFYELLPNYAQVITNVTISQGDSINASLTQTSAGQWTINLSDKTDGESFSVSVSYTSSLSSAEWIEEDPSYSFRQQVPFDNFQEASFTNANTVIGNITDDLIESKAQPITMLNGVGQTVAAPSIIAADSVSFNITP